MPFGVSCAPEIYQKAQQQLISGLPGVRCLADDVIIFGCGDTVEEAMVDHNGKLQATLQRFRERGLKLNRSKMKIALTSVPFFGHVLTDNGVQPDSAKISAVLNIPTPKNKKELMTFLGLTTYLGKFLPKLADISAPLRKLTRDKVEFNWSDEAEHSFQQIKRLATQTPILRYYDASEELIIQCDASKLGVGCALLQKGRPVAYASRTLTKTESNYAPIERECLAIVFACKRFDQYIAGRQAVVESDHKPLEEIFKKPITDAPLRLQRMRMSLQRYDITVRYKRGADMHIADLLSRTATRDEASKMSDAETLIEGKIDAAFLEIASTNVVEFINMSDERFKIIAQATKADQTLCKLSRTLVDGWPERKEDLDDDLHRYCAIKNELSLHQGVIFKSDRILVPKNLRNQFIEKLHTAHLGIDYTLRAARESLYWPGMSEQITNYIRNCEVCMTFGRSQSRKPMMSHPIPDYPFQRVNIDLGEVMQDGKKNQIMVIADSFSDFIEVDFLRNAKTRSIVKICKGHFARHGTPEVVVTDNGPQFDNAEWRKFQLEWGFSHVTSAPYHAQGNGKSESAIKTMKQLFRKCSRSGTDFWKALLQHRNTPNAVGSSPNQRLFSRDTRSEIPLITNKLQPPKATQVKQKITEKRQIIKASYDKRARELPELCEGDNVFIQRRPDITAEWEKAVLFRKFPDLSYGLETQDGRRYRRSAIHVKPNNNHQKQQEESDTLKEATSAASHVFKRYDYKKHTHNYEEEATTDDREEDPVIDHNKEQSIEGVTDKHISKGRSTRVIRKPARFSDFV
ncbi:uncharacterized protein K02A2.6-like [Armigeres subalbatus]|uniref:uncharacterized protein K02A2.6-like n=1 Tax=Armigeres subalbatus TaxID=124917 RepID=UPI002ED3DD75